MFKKVFEFENIGKVININYVNVRCVGVWTDGLIIKSECEPDWPCAFELKENKKYRITIEELIED